MKISILILDTSDNPHSGNITTARNMLAAFFLIHIMVLATTACLPVSPETVSGIEHLACVPEVHFVTHKMTCEGQPRGNWPYKCQVSGTVENSGSSDVTGVLVWVEYGRAFNGARSAAFNVIGNLAAGQKAEFRNEIAYFERLTQYDIRVECIDR